MGAMELSLDVNCGYVLGFFLEVAERSATVQSHLVFLGFGSRGMSQVSGSRALSPLPGLGGHLGL